MSGLVKAIVTGQNLALETADPVDTVEVAAGATPTKAEFDAFAAEFNKLVAELRGNGQIK